MGSSAKANIWRSPCFNGDEALVMEMNKFWRSAVQIAPAFNTILWEGTPCVKFYLPLHTQAKNKGTQGNFAGNSYVYYLDCSHAPTTACVFMSKLCMIISIYINIRWYALNMWSRFFTVCATREAQTSIYLNKIIFKKSKKHEAKHQPTVKRKQSPLFS